MLTQEEQLSICKDCKERRFTPESGLTCGITGEKPSFGNFCPNYREDAEAKADNERRLEELETPSEISGFLAFFLYFMIPAGIVMSAISIYLDYKSPEASESFFLRAYDIVFFLAYLYSAVYTIYGFHKRRPDTLYFAKYLAVVVFVTNLLVLLVGPDSSSFFSNAPRLVISLVWIVFIFVFLSTSDDVQERIPKRKRKIAGANKIIFILSIVLPILLFVGGVLEVAVKTASDQGVKVQIEQACKQYNKTFPQDIGNGIVLTKMYVEGNNIVYEYVQKDVKTDDYTKDQKDLLGLLARENLHLSLGQIVKDEMVPLLIKAGYDVKWKYKDSEGWEMYSAVIKNSMLSAAMEPGFTHKTTSETFNRMIYLFRMNLPYELADDLSVSNVSISDDGNTLLYDLMIRNADNSLLASLTSSYLKEYLSESLPYIEDAPLVVAIKNGKDLEFRFHADSRSSWLMTAWFTEAEYSKLINEESGIDNAI